MKPDINQGVKLFLKRGCRVKAGSFILLTSLITLLYALWNLTLERFSYDLEKCFRQVCYQPMDEKIKTWTLRFAPKGSLNVENALFNKPVAL